VQCPNQNFWFRIPRIDRLARKAIRFTTDDTMLPGHRLIFEEEGKPCW
jgi:hypothetical protein